MSAASPAATARRSPAARQPAPPSRHIPPAFFNAAHADEDEEEFRVNLGDVPRAQVSMDVDGFKPSLLSRLFDLVSPLRRR